MTGKYMTDNKTPQNKQMTPLQMAHIARSKKAAEMAQLPEEAQARLKLEASARRAAERLVGGHACVANMGSVALVTLEQRQKVVSFLEVQFEAMKAKLLGGAEAEEFTL